MYFESCKLRESQGEKLLNKFYQFHAYKLRFPFNEFININTPRGNKALSYEPMQTIAAQGVQGIANENIQSGYINFCEPKIIEKKQGVASKKCKSSPIWLE